MARKSDPDREREVIPVIEEQIEVGKHRRETGRVRVARTRHEQVVHVDEPLEQEEIEVQRVPVDRVVAEPPPVRQQGDTTIIPVLEERIVVEKRLILREELHVTRHRRQSRYVADIPVRADEVRVERDEPPGDPSAR